MFDLIITLVIIIVPITLAGLLSAAETAITGLSPAKIHKLKTDGNKRAKLISELRENKELLINTILLVNSIFNIFASTVVTAILINLYGDEGVIYATIIMTIMTIIFAEVLPKTCAVVYPEGVALFLANMLRVTMVIFGPITNALSRVILYLIKKFKSDELSDNFVSPTEEIRGAIEMHHKQGLVDSDDKYMLEGVFYLSETRVGKAITHRKNMRSINLDLDIKEIINQIKDIHHTRIPVWKNKPDNIVGILDTRILLNHLLNDKIIDKEEISRFLTEPLFIHENTALDVLLDQFKRLKVRIAIVIDEYGDIQGLITLSDILEEVIGEFKDEYDSLDIVSEDVNSCIVKGEVAIRDINRALHWNLPDDDASTIAGLMIHRSEKIPELDETLIIDLYSCRVLSKEANQLTSIRIDRLEE